MWGSKAFLERCIVILLLKMLNKEFPIPGITISVICCSSVQTHVVLIVSEHQGSLVCSLWMHKIGKKSFLSPLMLERHRGYVCRAQHCGVMRDRRVCPGAACAARRALGPGPRSLQGLACTCHSSLCMAVVSGVDFSLPKNSHVFLISVGDDF